MKQTILMLGLLLVSVPWTFFNPFVGLAVYYGLALLRPQALWDWALLVQWRFSLIVGAATLAALALHGGARSRAARRWPVEKILLAVLAVLTCLSYLTAIDRAQADKQIFEFLKIFVMFFAACALLDRRGRLTSLAVVIVATLGYVALEYNIRYVFQGQWNSHTLRFDNLDNNGLAALIVMGMPFCLLLFARMRRAYLRAAALAAMVLMMHVVLFSLSRGGMLAMAVSLPWMLLRLKRRAMGLVLLVVVAGAALSLAGPQVRDRFLSIDRYEADASAQARLAAWRTARLIIRDHPWLGVGPLNYTLAAARYPDGQQGAVHNQFLQTAADMGLPAAAAMLGMFLAALAHLQSLRRRFRDDAYVVDLAACLQSSLMAFLVAAMFLSLGLIELAYVVVAMVVGLRNILAEELRARAQPAPTARAAPTRAPSPVPAGGTAAT